MTGMRVLPFGDRALLAEYADLPTAMAASRALDAARPEWVVELVPAARTVLARLAPGTTLGTAESWLRGVGAPDPADGPTAPGSAPPAPAGAVVIPVRYDGPDLVDAAEAAGLSPEALVARHTAASWTCGFVGFAPGFGYLVPDADDWVPMPRRATSRPSVPAGSVALAGEFSGVYPRESPGGWQLVGSTDAVLWDVGREPPALLRPGIRVRFEDVT